MVVDFFTRYAVLRPMVKKSSEALAKQLWQLFADFGVPIGMQSDQEADFCIDRELLRAFGVRGILQSCRKWRRRAVNPYCDSNAEKALQGANTDWPKWVPLVQMASNMAVNSIPAYVWQNLEVIQ